MTEQTEPKRALVADDEDVFCKLLAKTLSLDGFQVDTANDGMEAIELLDRHRYAVILTDLMMPRAGGLEVLRAARRTDPDVAVILVTGYASLDSALAAIKEGAYDYITKPFQLEEIRLTVSNALERRRLVDENKSLLESLEKAYRQIDDLMKRQVSAASEVDRELAARQKEIFDKIQSVRTLRGATAPILATGELQKKNEAELTDRLEAVSSTLNRQFVRSDAGSSRSKAVGS
ncbi:MAG: response regulator [Deltaproteobacteria bacterium]|nr:response regulator [Deltaproteobacteria bacterium]